MKLSLISENILAGDDEPQIVRRIMASIPAYDQHIIRMRLAGKSFKEIGAWDAQFRNLPVQVSDVRMLQRYQNIMRKVKARLAEVGVVRTP